MIKIVIFFFGLLVGGNLFAFQKNIYLENDRLSFLTFRMPDVNYLSYELSFVGLKNVRQYPFYSYAGAYIAHKRTTLKESIDGATSNSGINCAMMAAKGGVLAPLSKDVGIMALAAVSLGITAIGESPWWGRNIDRLDNPTLLGYEVGILFHHQHLITKLTYYGTNLKFLPGAVTFSFGVGF